MEIITLHYQQKNNIMQKEINQTGIIYKVENTENGMVYIGATSKDVETRKQDHLSKVNKDKRFKFQEAIGTYGPEAFSWEQIDTASSNDELAQKEKEYIVKYDSKSSGYNSDEGGGIKKTVYQYMIEDGRLLNTFDCLFSAANDINATKQDISRACLSVNQTYYGFYWSYIYKEPFEPPIKDERKKQVQQFSLEGELLATYISVAKASRQTGISKTCISRVCRGERESSSGFRWRYE